MLPFVVFAILWQLSNSTWEPTVVTAEVGQENVILPCKCLYSMVNIVGVEWTRSDITSPYYVFLNRDDHDVPEDQHPSFKTRVCLQDREMQEGNLSIILGNVTISDGGLYKCHVLTNPENRKKRDAEQMNIVHLKVVPKIKHTAGEDKDKEKDKEPGHLRPLVGWIFGVAGLLASACAVGFVIRRKKNYPRHLHQITVE